MASWRFYQGLRSEWRWYRFNDAVEVIAESDQGFAELPACMANATAVAGFSGETYQVHTRQPGDGTVVDEEKARSGPAKPENSEGWKGSPPSGGPLRQAAA